MQRRTPQFDNPSPEHPTNCEEATGAPYEGIATGKTIVKNRPWLSVSHDDLKYLTAVWWLIIAAVITIAISHSFRKNEERDFVYFYSIGDILNRYPAEKLYDFNLQNSVFEQVLPLTGGQHYGPSPYPPFVAMFFRPLAKFPYWTAFRIWLAINLVLYIAGLWLLAARFCRDDALQRSLAFCFGLSFWPFISWILLGGQLSAVGFLAMALAIYWEDKQRYFASGLALSVCLYKPTLLLLVLPMLLVIRRFKTLAGFAAGATALIGVCGMVEGLPVWAAYIRTSANFAGHLDSLPLRNYIDLRAFSAALPRAHLVALIFGVCAGAISGACLLRVWWKSRYLAANAPATLVWTTTLTWTLLLNVYVPVYDSVFVIISAIAGAATLIRFAPRVCSVVGVALLASSYTTTWIAKQTGLQVMTLSLAAFGALQLAALFRTFAANPNRLP